MIPEVPLGVFLTRALRVADPPSESPAGPCAALAPSSAPSLLPATETAPKERQGKGQSSVLSYLELLLL